MAKKPSTASEKMSDEFNVDMHYGGVGSINEGVFDYRGGSVKKGMAMDPDYVTWSIFDDFCERRKIPGLVEKVWYKLRHEDISSARLIYEDKDAQIRQFCLEALTTGEVDIYIHQEGCESDKAAGEHEHGAVDNQAEGETEQAGEEDEDEVEAQPTEHDKFVEEHGEDPVEDRGKDDPRLQSFLDEVQSNERNRTEPVRDGVERNQDVATDGVHVDDPDDSEDERQCADPEADATKPKPPVVFMSPWTNEVFDAWK